jgi:MYXO-CTERM domain-containing protein
VSFYDGATLLGTVAANASGVATYVASGLDAGNHTLKADYAGDGAHQPSSGTVNQVVDKAPTATALSSTPDPSVFGQSTTLPRRSPPPRARPPARSRSWTARRSSRASRSARASRRSRRRRSASARTRFSGVGQPVTFTASVSSTVAGATGEVEFFDGSLSLGKGTLAATSDALVSTATLGVGGHPITATFSTDGVHAASTSPVLQQDVQDAAVTPPPPSTPPSTPPETTPPVTGVNPTAPDAGSAVSGCCMTLASSSSSGSLAALPLVGVALLAARRRRRRSA